MLYLRLLALLLIISPLLSNAQSAWTQKDNGHYMQVGWSVFPNYSEYKRRGGNDFVMPRTVLEQTFQFYGEYGIKDRLTLIYDLPVKQTHIGNFVEDYEGGAINKAGTKVGLGNIGLGVRGLVYDTNGKYGQNFRNGEPVFHVIRLFTGITFLQS